MVRPNASKMTRPDTVITWAGPPPSPGSTGSPAHVMTVSGRAAGAPRGRRRVNGKRILLGLQDTLEAVGERHCLDVVGDAGAAGELRVQQSVDMAGQRPRHRWGVGWVGGRKGEVDGVVIAALLVRPDHMNEAAEIVVAVADDLAVLVGGRGDFAELEVVGRG